LVQSTLPERQTRKTILNNFALTIEPRRYDAAKKSGQLELVGIAERRQWEIATMRGSIDWVVFYAVDRPMFTADFLSSSETDSKITIRFAR